MAEAGEISYGDRLLEALKGSELCQRTYLEDSWHHPIEKRERSVMAESISRGVEILAKKAA